MKVRLMGGFLGLLGMAVPSISVACRSNMDAIILAGETVNMGSVPADSMPAGQPLSAWKTTHYPNIFTSITSCSPRPAFSSFSLNSRLRRGSYRDSDGMTYTIFETSLPSVGFVIGVKEGHVDSWRDAGQGATPGLGGAGANVSLSLRVRFISTGGRLAVGSSVIPTPGAVLGTFIVTSESAPPFGMPTTNIYMNPFVLNVNARGCRITQGQNQSVSMPQVVAQSFKSVGSESDISVPFSLSLQCDPNVTVYAGMSDALNGANRSTTLSTSGKARGLGVRIYREGDGVSTPVAYGPDASAPGNYPHRWTLGNTGSGASFELPFVARYVQTAQTVTAGDLAARAVITFSYQ